MIDTIFWTPQEVATRIAVSAKEMRLYHNLSQKTLSDRSGVSWGVIKKFERTGKISLESLLKLSLTLGCLEEFTKLFTPPKPSTFSTLDEIIKKKPRKRGTK